MIDGAIVVDRVNHSFGDGPLGRQVLFDVSAEVRRGEIVILMGPSGSGKTTLLTLMGALRSTQEGSLRVLGRELRGLPSRGDHHNNQLTVGPDGKLYFGQGTATNSGVVGLDSFHMGWLAKQIIDGQVDAVLIAGNISID